MQMWTSSTDHMYQHTPHHMYVLEATHDQRGGRGGLIGTCDVLRLWSVRKHLLANSCELRHLEPQSSPSSELSHRPDLSTDTRQVDRCLPTAVSFLHMLHVCASCPAAVTVLSEPRLAMSQHPAAAPPNHHNVQNQSAQRGNLLWTGSSGEAQVKACVP